MKSFLEVIIYTPQEHNQSSYFHTGLFELEQKGILKCRIVLDTAEKRGTLSTIDGTSIRSNHPQPKTSYYKLIDNKKNKEINFAVDAYDIAHFFSEYALKKCDFVFKRNYEKKYICPLEKSYQHKLKPLGLSFGSLSRHRHDRFKLLSGLLISNLRLHLKIDRYLFSKFFSIIRKKLDHWYFVQNARLIDSFQSFSVDTELTVIFQTRCFARSEEPDVQEIHSQRADLIRILRKRLGKQFIGGFIPDEVSKKYYTDCLTNMSTDPQGYLQLVKKASIGIYTRGLANSPAWKLAEYLSQGKCIVAEPLTTELPVPLEHGKHLMYFHSPEECADICEMLLKDPAQMQKLSRNARAYYEEHVDPVANVKRIINLMLASERINE